jgi:hypothetical protein
LVRDAQLGGRNRAARRREYLLVGRGRIGGVEAGVGVRLEAPALCERAGVDGVETQSVDQRRRVGFRAAVITGDRQRGAVGDPRVLCEPRPQTRARRMIRRALAHRAPSR